METPPTIDITAHDHDPVPVNEPVTVTADDPVTTDGTKQRNSVCGHDNHVCDHEGGVPLTLSTPDVTWVTSGISTDPSSGSGTSATFTPKDGGECMVEFTAKAITTDPYGDYQTTATATLQVVKVQKIQWKDATGNWTDVASPLNILKGTSVTFRAVQAPANANWPPNKPTWGGTAGASGTGEEVTVQFVTEASTLTDFKTVTCECGNIPPVSVDILVFEFEIGLTPAVDFPGRNYVNYGIGEIVNLNFIARPQGVPLPGIELSYNQNAHQWVSPFPQDHSNLDQPGMTFNCGSEAETIELKARIKDGPSEDKLRTKTFNVVAPSAVVMVQRNNSKYHDYNFASCGKRADYFVQPNNVAFTRIGFREGFAPIVKTGWYANKPIGDHPPTPQFLLAHIPLPWAQPNGNYIGYDTFSPPRYAFDPNDPWAPGTLAFAIPIQYMFAVHVYNSPTTANFLAELNVAGGVGVSKLGVTAYANISDPSSTYDDVPSPV